MAFFWGRTLYVASVCPSREKKKNCYISHFYL
jgi:hypothetical protein